MADDLNKKIKIEVELEADNVKQNIADLNKAIDVLLAQQKQLDAAGGQNTATFESVSKKLEDFQKKLESVTDKLKETTTAAGNLSTAGTKLDQTLKSVAEQQQKNAKVTTETTTKTKELVVQVNAATQSVQQQQADLSTTKAALDGYAASVSKSETTAAQLHTTISETTVEITKQAAEVGKNKTEFDAHKLTMDHLKTSFDEIKDVSGIFGPSLQEAAKGFGVMKTGLNLVKDGFTGVGEAIKADGFEFLLEILQLMFDYFIKSSNGSKILAGAISAVGVVVNEVKGFFDALMGGIVNAFSHPLETLKSLGRMIEENLINRVKAFAVILDGIIHLDFKKVANGVIQASTGITNAIEKTGKAIAAVKKEVGNTLTQMGNAYEEGYTKAGKQIDDHEAKVKASNNRQIASYNDLEKQVQKTYDEQQRQATRGEQLDVRAPSFTGLSNGTPEVRNLQITNLQSKKDQATADAKVNIYRQAEDKIKDYAKQNADKIAKDAVGTLSKSIEQQSAAKIAGLERSKAKELSNASLTSAQKLAIEAKYRKQEGAIKAKAFKEQQELSIAQALINGAEAVTKVWAVEGPLGALEVGVVIAETAAQVEKIAKQKPPAYAKGGLHYTSDGRGGVLPGYSRTDNTNAFLRSGEGVVVSEAMQVPWARNLVSAINVGFGGRDFAMANPGRGYAVGGIFTDGGDANRYYNQPVNDQKNLANTIAYQMINNFPPVYVDVKDINNQQNILAQTVNRVDL